MSFFLSPRKLFWAWLNAVALGGIFVLMVNFSIVNWSLNPVVDFLYARTLGPEFYLNHYVSGVAVCFTMLVFAIKDRTPFRSSMIVLSIVAVHEIAYEVILKDVNGNIPLEYVTVLSAYLCLGVFFASNAQRKHLVTIFIAIVVYVTLWNSFLLLSGHNPHTIVELANGSFLPGPMYYDPVDAVLELTSWLLPLFLWHLLNRAVPEAKPSLLPAPLVLPSSQASRPLSEGVSSCSQLSNLPSSQEKLVLEDP